MLTIVYSHLARSAFEEYKRACVGDEEVLQAFDLNPAIDYNTLWDVSTSEIASGEYIKNVQLAVVQDNLLSNHKCEGRRNVSYSRGQMFTSTHMISECFSNDRGLVTWKEQFKVLHTPRSGYSVTEVVCHRAYVRRATADDWFRE